MTHLTVGGHLKIYLGYAPGVGKTYQMLEDARELKARGVGSDSRICGVTRTQRHSRAA